MATFKIVPEPYDHLGDVERVINYAVHTYKADSFGAFGVIPTNVKTITNQFLTVKKIYNKTDGKQLRHFIVSFADDEDVSPEQAYYLGYKIASYYAQDYQIVFAVHDNTDNLHIHFVMNSVNYNTGLKYAEGMEDFNNIKRHIQNIMDEHCSAC